MLKPYGEFTNSQGKQGWQEMWDQIPPDLRKAWKDGARTKQYPNFKTAVLKKKYNLIQNFIGKQWEAGNIDEIGHFKKIKEIINKHPTIRMTQLLMETES